MRSCACLPSVALCISLTAAIFRADAAVPSAEELLRRMAEREGALQNICGRLTVTTPETGTALVEAEWGFSHGREYLKGTTYMDFGEAGKRHVPCRTELAFDGKRMCILRSEPFAKRHSGRVTCLRAEDFSGLGTLNRLMGYDLHPTGRLPLSESLKQAQSLRVLPEMQTVDGHTCHVVEAMGIRLSVEPDSAFCDARVWIDPERDDRMLKLDLYRVLADPFPRWSYHLVTIDSIVLNRVEGVWVPIEGLDHPWHVDLLPKPGTTPEALAGMTPDQYAAHVRCAVRPLMPARLIRVAPETVEIGRDVPAERFAIDWPMGTIIWDDFVQTAYRVGGVGNADSVAAVPEVPQRRSEEAHGEDRVSTPPSSVPITPVAHSADINERSVLLLLVGLGVIGALLLCAVWGVRRRRIARAGSSARNTEPR